MPTTHPAEGYREVPLLGRKIATFPLYEGSSPMKVVACYIRVSMGEKNQAGQRREINHWLKRNRINPKTVRWYIDKSTSDTLNRRAFEKLQADISNREVGTVVIWRLDRLSPTMREGLMTTPQSLYQGE